MRKILVTLLLALLVVSTAAGLTSCLVDDSPYRSPSDSASIGESTSVEPGESTSEPGESESDSELGESTSEPEEVVSYTLEVIGGKRSFYVGEVFVSQGLTVILKAGDVNDVLTEDEYEIDFSSFNGNVLGEYIITVSYKENRELEAEYTVRVMRDEENENVWGKDLWL